MYLRIIRAHFDPAAAEQVAVAIQEVPAALSQRPGVKRIQQGIDATAGTGAMVSIWDTEEQANFTCVALGDPIDRLQALGVQFEEPEIYELMPYEDVVRLGRAEWVHRAIPAPFESSFDTIDRRLDVVEEWLATLTSSTRETDTQDRELGELRQQVADLTAHLLGASHPLVSGLGRASVL